MSRLWATFLIGWMAQAAHAQQQISPEAFLDRATGNTLTFSNPDGDYVIGIEKFLSRERSVWAPQNGFCSYGVIRVRGPLLCFLYEDYPNPDNCWMPFADDNGLLVMSRSSFEVQRITVIDDTPVDCEDAPMS